MKKLFYAVTGAVFLGLTAPVIGATGEAWAEEVIGPDVLVPEGYRNGEQGRDAVKEIGPGIREEENVSSAVGNALIPSNDFLDAMIPNPVVKPVEKYTYDQMVADINALKERYGDKMQVNVIGRSQDGRGDRGKCQCAEAYSDAGCDPCERVYDAASDDEAAGDGVEFL